MRDCAKLSMRYKGVGQSIPEGARCKLTIRPLVVEREVGGGKNNGNQVKTVFSSGET